MIFPVFGVAAIQKDLHLILLFYVIEIWYASSLIVLSALWISEIDHIPSVITSSHYSQTLVPTMTLQAEKISGPKYKYPDNEYYIYPGRITSPNPKPNTKSSCQIDICVYRCGAVSTQTKTLDPSLRSPHIRHLASCVKQSIQKIWVTTRNGQLAVPHDVFRVVLSRAPLSLATPPFSTP